MKLCKDCKYYRCGPFDWLVRAISGRDLSGCYRKKRSEISGVDGKQRVMGLSEFAEIERKYEPPTGCGKEAEYFEPK